MNSNDLFKEISWQNFELLCLKYVEKKYGTGLDSNNKESIHIESNIGQGNTGCDAAIYYAHQKFDQTIWFEFKRHSRNIGLDVIGKYAVILVSRAIGKFVLLSASNITNSALAEFSDFMYKSNIEAEYIFGSHLMTEFKKHLSLETLQHFSLVSEINNNSKPLINLSFLDGNPTSSFYSNCEQSQKKIEIRRGDVFYLMFSIYNPTSNAFCITSENIMGLSKQIQTCAPYLKVNYIGSPLMFSHKIKEHQCLTIKFACYSVKQVSEIFFPPIQISIEIKGVVQEFDIEIPILKFIRPKQSILLGKENITFLSSVFSLVLTLQKPKPFIVLIEGLSGTGKTKLLNEILCKAKIEGINVYHQNGENDISLNFIRRFLSDCLNLQFGKFNGQYTKEYLVDLCSKNSIPCNHGINIHDFLVNKKESDEILYSVSEILGFAISRSPKEPRLIAIDNLQEFNNSFIAIVDKLIELAFVENIAFSIVVVSNVEKIASKHKQISSFIKRITNRSINAPGFCVKHICKELNFTDACSFLNEKLPDLSSHFLSVLINKIGTRPLDLEISSSYLDEIGLIKDDKIETNSSTLLFNSKRKIPEKIRYIYQARIDNLIYQNSDNKDILMILSWMLLMNYGLPYEFIPCGSSTSNAIDTLINLRIIKLTSDENRICFFHQNMADFISSYSPVVAAAMESSEKLYSLLTKGRIFLSELEYETAKFNIQYYLEPSSNIKLEQAKKVIELLNKSGYHSQSMVICKKALRSEQVITSSNAHNIIYIKTTCAFLETEFFNLNDGVKLLKSARKEVIKWKGHLPKPVILNYFINLLNGLLHSGQDKEAITTINSVSTYIEDTDYNLQFHLVNRKCVAHMHLNETDFAIDEAAKAIQIAKRISDPFYLSKAHSDIAYAFLSSIYKTSENLVKAISSYNKGIEIHSLVQTDLPSRDIEISNHKGIVYLLEGDYKRSSDISKIGLQTCFDRHYMYLYPRICLLASTAEINMGNLDNASKFLNDAYAVSKEYDYPHVWKILNNLAIIDALKGRVEDAKDKINSAIEYLKTNINNDFIFLKEQAVIRNAIYLASVTSTDINQILKKIKDKNNYWAYANQCNHSNNLKSVIRMIKPGDVWDVNNQSGLECIFL